MRKANYLVVKKYPTGGMRSIFCTEDPKSAAASILGRVTSEWMIVKSDHTGDRVVPMAHEVSQLERNCIDA